MPTGNLPPKGKALWEKVYNEAKDSGDDEEKAAQKAWGAVKNAGWEKKDGKWVKSSNLVEFSLRIERAIFDKPTQEMRWKAVTSDVDVDLHTDNMTLSLYEDFIRRIESGEQVPEEYRSEFWSGGMPYLSVAHYDDLDGEAVPGTVESTYIDGKALKARGIFSDTVLGRNCFNALCDDLYNKNSKHEDKVRVSIGFLDYSHRHKSDGYVFVRESLDDICFKCLEEMITGEGKGKEYLKGHLIHYALTRVPVNTRTSMEVEKSMAIKTRKEDASTIIGEEEAEKLEELQRAKKSKSAVLVTMSESDEDVEVAEEVAEEETPEVEPTPVVEESKHMKDSEDEDEESMDDEEEDKKEKKKKEKKSEVTLSDIFEKLNLIVPEKATEPEDHPLDEAISALKKDFSDALTLELTPDEKLKLIQESYARVGESIVNIVKAETQEDTQPTQTTVADNDQLIKLASIVEGLAQKVDLLAVTLDKGKEFQGPKVPEQRSYQPPAFNPFLGASTHEPGKPLSLHAIVNRSVGLPDDA